MGNHVRVSAVRARLEDGSALRIPYWTLDSGREGPCFLLCAAQHGNEVQGSEVIRRFMNIAAGKLRRGSVIGVPFVNPLALHERRPHIHMKPGELNTSEPGRNMNTTWPGDAKGNDVQRLCHALHRLFDGRVTHVFDIHCWNKHAAPGLLCWPSPAGKALARKAGCRFVHVMDVSGKLIKGMLGFPYGDRALAYECAGQYDVCEDEVRKGLAVAVNFARALGMLPGRPNPGKGPALFSDETKVVEVKAPTAGLFVKSGHNLSDFVRKGASLGHILDERRLKARVVRAPVSGWLKQYGICRSNGDMDFTGLHPYAASGERLARIEYPLPKGRRP